MYVSTVTISEKGQIVLPKKIRDMLKTRVISIEINKNNNVILSPLRDLGGSLAAYQKVPNLPFEEIRDQAWNDSILERHHLKNSKKK